MSGPWEQYQKQGSVGPWAQYGRSPDASDRSPAGPPGPWSGFGRAVVDAATLGLADEARAAGNAVGGVLARALGMADPSGSFSADYDRALASERSANAAMTTGQRIGGALVGGLAAAPQATVQGISRLARGLRAAGQGSVLGAGYGVGSGEGDSWDEGAVNRATLTGVGAAAGGVAGAAAPVIAGAARTVASSFRPATRAANRLGEAMRRSGQRADDITTRLGELGPEATIADAGGRNVQGLARAVANLPGEGRELAETAVASRAQAQPERVTETITRQFGAGEDWHPTFNALGRARQKAAQPLYQAAYSRPVPFTRELEDILETDAGRKALARARRIASNEGVDFQQLFISVADDGKSAIARRVPDMRGWDYIKRGLDDVVEGYRDKTTSRLALDTEGRSVVGVRERLLSALDDANPEYRAAREAWAGPSQAMEAMEQGRLFARRPSEITQERLSRLSPADREFFRLGVARHLWEQAGSNAGSARIVRDTLGNRNFQRALQAVSPSREAYEQFMGEMRRLAAFRDTNQNLFGGSRTAVLEREMADIDGGAVRDMVTAVRTGGSSGLGGLLMRAGGGLANRARAGVQESTRNELARMLFTTDPAQQQAALQATQQAQQNRAVLAAMLARPAALGAASASVEALQRRALSDALLSR